MRSTLMDIAREAGVSTATVDRVLNNREGVRERTRQAVLETARKLGYVTPPDEEGGNANAPVRLDFVLPAGTNTFIANLLDQLVTQAGAQDGMDVHVHSIEGFNPDSLARQLDALTGTTQGVGVLALDHPTVREAMRKLAASGVPIVTLVSDILHVPRLGYVGIDNRAAGRLAGYLLGRLLGKGAKRKIALFAGSLSYRGHEEREMGFRHVIAEEFQDLEVVELREIRDDRQRAFEETAALLKRHPDLSGIYNIGAGNAGIGQALQEAGFAQSVIFVGHELTERTKRFLLDGTMDAVIDQNPRVEAREALAMLKNTVLGRRFDYHPPRLQVIFRENIPEF
ncbi:LacI family DNA-binding transcriptional regulator [Sinorhizobium mexicanum]|uniref:LacI family transcriptional regulator n=1 Tax=Sinorhizobium mexicanum TaxID=375549 RepID=A0A859R1G7_9HYPH|nr:LacI family DNA-binding transcriptional regulator [Sinorhizobium mexicanum]MBP1884136.1 LacI family transcriptional regulator [Sinorhizobium mexicanum]QLL64851.1 LacI family transcriptional regulator [Sinorhizobium mexicanum]